jgi:arylsulfatase A-like enzyme
MPQFQEGTPASAASNYPLRGGKTTLYEGGVRGVSFVAGGTNVLPATAAGTVVTDLMHAADMLPTVAAIAGVSLIDNTMNVDTSGNADADAVAGMDGISMADVFLKGAKGKRMEVPINILDNCDLCHRQKKSLGPKGNFNFSALIMLDTDIATGKNTLWKLISGHVGGYDGWWSNGDYTHEAANTTYPNAYQLFNLSEDEVERVDLATTHPDVANKLLARLKVLGDATQGYKPPQYNIPSKEGKPEYHNGTWAPFQS